MSGWPYQMAKADLEAIHNAALAVLDKAGVVFHHHQALEIFKKHGARVEGRTVHLSEQMVAAALQTAPGRFTIHGRDEAKSIDVGGPGTHLAPGYGAPFVIDGDGTKRPASMDDYRAFCKLAHTSDQVDINGFLVVEPAELDPASGHLDMLLETMLSSDKPFISCPLSEQALSDNIAMANILFGGEKAIDGKPVMIPTINPLTPLQFAEEMAGAIILHAQWGQPIAVTNVIQSGASGPIRMAGSMALSVAEVLAGLVLDQLVRPGTPFLLGNSCCPVDMRTGGMALGSPETAQFFSLGVQMARFYGLPCRAGGALTDSYAPDIRAGMESTLLQTASMGNDTDIIFHAFGILGSYLAMSFEKYLADEELSAMIRKALQPVEVSPESLGVETICRIGPGGQYLMEMDTLKRCRTEFHVPRLAARKSYGDWASAGRLYAEAEGAKRLAARLEGYIRPDIDPAIERDLKAFVTRRKAEK